MKKKSLDNSLVPKSDFHSFLKYQSYKYWWEKLREYLFSYPINKSFYSHHNCFLKISKVPIS